MTPIVDIHTHRQPPAPGAIVNIDPTEEHPDPAQYPRQYFSAGVHPWRSCVAMKLCSCEDSLRNLLLLPNVVAVGETGLDRRRGAPLSVQLPLFEAQVALAEELQMPVILHIVAAWQEMLDVRKRLRPRQLWIVHGYRGNATLAQQLVDHGIALSLGPRYNAAAAAVIPPHMLYTETDTADNLPVGITPAPFPIPQWKI